MPLTVVSWNLLKLSAEKVCASIGGGVALADFIAQTASNCNADLLLLMELRRSAACDLYSQMLKSLNAMQAVQNPALKWLGFQSDPTGKIFELPPFVTLPSGVDKAKYAPVLELCYAPGPTPAGNGWLLKGPSEQRDRASVVRALELLNKLNPDLEEYGIFFRCDATTNEFSLWWSTPAGVGMSRLMSGTRSTGLNGQELGYQSPTSPFNGRSPCLVQLFIGSAMAPYGIPLLLFHAPWGSSMKPRVLANTTLPLIAAVGGPGGVVATCEVGQAPFSMLCGDFNLDVSKGGSAEEFYGAMRAMGYQVGIDEPSTLRSNVEQTVASSLTCRSSAYDNVLVKPTGRFVEAAIYDVIAALVSGQYQNVVGTPSGQYPIYGAYSFYLESVSDHLPAVATINL